jgi:hypothetical protein
LRDELPERVNGGLDRVDVAVADVPGVPVSVNTRSAPATPAQEEHALPGLPRADAGIDDGVHARAVDEGEIAQVEAMTRACRRGSRSSRSRRGAVAASSSPVRRPHAPSRPSSVHEHSKV